MNDTNEIIKTYGNRLYSAAFLVSRNPEDAEDAVQEALIRYWQNDKEFESEEHKKAWLLRVTINLAKSTRRSFWNRNRLSIEDYMETLEFEEPQDRELMEAVMALPENLRVVTHLHYYEGYKVKEIADMLNVPENTVKTRLLKSRKELKEKLKEGWQDEE